VTGRGLWLVALAPLLAGAGLFQTRNADVEKGNAAMAAGKAEDALAHYDKAVAKLPAEAGVHFDRGAALYALSRFDEAGPEHQRATDSDDVALKAEAFRGLGNAHFKKDKFKDAVEAYKRALALRPDDQAAKRNLELALLKKKEEEKKEQDNKDKDKDNKDKQDDKDKKDDQSKKDQDKDKQDKKDDQKQGEDKKDEKDKKEQQPKPAGEDKAQQLEALLKNLEGNPKDLEKERARLRAVRRGRPARDW
jgi:tetratricopeptide (TPR) repeat protein